jgi:hypothetical protein
MTVAPHPTTPLPAWLTNAQAAMSSPYDPLVSAEQARVIVAQIGRLEAQLASRKAAFIRIVDSAELAKRAGSTSTGSLISGDFGGDRASASRQVRTARNLAKATVTDQALAAGDISADKAAVIAGAIAGLPESLDEHTRLRVEKRLIIDAKLYSLPDLRRRVIRIADLYSPTDDADADENEKLRRQEAAAWQNTELWFGQARGGLVPFGGKMPVLHAELLKNQVGAIAAPRRRGLDTPGLTAGHSTTEFEQLTYSQRMGRAFCHWIEHIPTDGLPVTGGTPATLTINLDHDTLAQQVRQAAGTLATGERLSASEIRRLACSHGILPRVLDGTSQILDQGRAKRLYTPPQRLALADRDNGCTYPGCDRPPSWTEAHHLNHWERDHGQTTLNNAALLCARHHHWVHSEGIDGRIRDNRVQFQIHGIWQTNHRWRP